MYIVGIYVPHMPHSPPVSEHVLAPKEKYKANQQIENPK